MRIDAAAAHRTSVPACLVNLLALRRVCESLFAAIRTLMNEMHGSKLRLLRGPVSNHEPAGRVVHQGDLEENSEISFWKGIAEGSA